MNHTQLTAMEELKKHEATINSLLESRNSQREELEEQSTLYRGQLDKAINKINESERLIDSEGYNDGIKEKHDLEFKIRGNDKLIETLGNRPLLEESSYTSLKNELKSSMDKIIVEAKNDVQPLIEQIELIEKSVMDSHLLTNRLLQTLQKDVQLQSNVREEFINGRVQRIGVLDDKYQKQVGSHSLAQAKSNLKNFIDLTV